MEENREQIEKTCCCQCSERKKERSEKEYKDLINRLSRIEGQVRGVKGMLEKDAYCADILVQVSAINSARRRISNTCLPRNGVEPSIRRSRAGMWRFPDVQRIRGKEQLNKTYKSI